MKQSQPEQSLKKEAKMGRIKHNRQMFTTTTSPPPLTRISHKLSQHSEQSVMRSLSRITLA